ncbi:uncharacterized protein LOC125502643 [Dendroctonus ponderosae]|uniref:uncharacterized protein LOC125502643 n=1 Tax=Dendroctonus ponderosae TaxID=77166 RepID=UPI002035D04E|nr:uncharacterized protein LOC125502643 [Dendroctonus ponderosae]
MLGISLRDTVRNENIIQRTKVTDIMELVAHLNWQWVGHVARQNRKWTKKLIQWRPRETRRTIGRPPKMKRRCEENSGHRLAANRSRQKCMEEIGRGLCPAVDNEEEQEEEIHWKRAQGKNG